MAAGAVGVGSGELGRGRDGQLSGSGFPFGVKKMFWRQWPNV